MIWPNAEAAAIFAAPFLATRNMHNKILIIAARCFTLGLTVLSCAAAPAPTNNTFFGFTGPETFPIDPFIAELRAADLDGDGLTDLIIVNNSRSKITLLYNQTGKTNLAAASKGVKRELNELPPDARFRIEDRKSVV